VVGEGNNVLALKKLEDNFKPVHDELVRLRNMSSLRWYVLFLRHLESGELGDLGAASKSTATGKASAAVNRVFRRRQAVSNAGHSAWIEATIKSLSKRTVMCEDVLPIMFLHGFIHGFPNFNGVIHAVIDEAQDYSILHFQYLRTLLPELCTITIVGDPFQAINPFVRTTDFQALMSVFPECVVTPALEYSYRSSSEITEFAASLLPGSPAIKNVRSTNVVPELVNVASGKTPDVIGKLVLQLNREGYPSVGVVCKSCAEAEALYDVLGRSVDVKLLNDKTTEFSAGNYVTPLIYAKGLEFDAVIIADASNRAYRSEMDRRPLYTACTRALHRLYLCYEKARSPLLPPEAAGLFALRKTAKLR
jgi:DNA helicase-2/ATP-dependent DNA helicase PcrA